MRHNHSLVSQRDPIGDIKLMRFWIVKSGDLLSKQIDHEGVQVESFRDQAESFGTSLSRVTLRRILVFVYLLDYVRADFFARAQGLPQRTLQLQPGYFAHLFENFIGRGNKLGIARSVSPCRRRRGCCLLPARHAGVADDSRRQH
jgi:hypothetical protein